MDANLARILAANADYAVGFSGSTDPRPRRGLAVVTCMDARIDVFAVLGLELGDAHVIRNAGGLVTDDVIRSLVISQRFLETTRIIVIGHTRCGLHDFSDDWFEMELKSEAGVAPPWRAGGFAVVEEAVQASVTRLADSPFLKEKSQVAGMVWDTESGQLTTVGGTW